MTIPVPRRIAVPAREFTLQPTGFRHLLVDLAIDVLTIVMGVAVLVVPAAGRPVPSWAVAVTVIIVALGVCYDLAGATVAPALRFTTAVRRASAIPLAAISLVPLALDWRTPVASATAALVVVGLAVRPRHRDIGSGRAVGMASALSALVGLAWMGAAQTLALKATYRGPSPTWILQEAIPAAAPTLVAVAAVLVPVLLGAAARGGALPVATAAALALAAGAIGTVPATDVVTVAGWPLLAAAGAMACGKPSGGQRIVPRVAVFLAVVSMVVTTAGFMVVADDRSAPLEQWRVAVALAWVTIAVTVFAAWSRQDSAASTASWIALATLAVARIFSAPRPDVGLLVLAATAVLLAAGALHRAWPTLATAIGFGRESAGRTLA